MMAGEGIAIAHVALVNRRMGMALGRHSTRARSTKHVPVLQSCENTHAQFAGLQAIARSHATSRTG